MQTLREVRESKGLSQTDLAKLVKIHQVEISLLESGKHFPQIKTRRQIESILGRINWITAGPLPSKRNRKQKTLAKIEEEFISCMDNIDGLRLDEKLNLLYQIIDYVVKYTNTISEAKHLENTKWNLILSKLRNWIGVKKIISIIKIKTSMKVANNNIDNRMGFRPSNGPARNCNS